MKMFVLATISCALLADVMAQVPTPAATVPTETEAPVYNEELGCWPISVEHDATYCIAGPICSGSGPEPAGRNCPVVGDVAIADCHSYLPSYNGASGSCVAPANSVCQVIKTGAWGCIWSGNDDNTPGEDNGGNGGTGATGGNGGGNGGDIGGSVLVSSGDANVTVPGANTSAGSEAVSDEDIIVPTSNLVAGVVETSSSSSAALVGTIAAVAGVACVVIGVVIYQKRKKNAVRAAEKQVVDMALVSTP